MIRLSVSYFIKERNWELSVGWFFYAGLCPTPHQRNFLEKVPLESSKTFKNNWLVQCVYSHFTDRSDAIGEGKNGTYHVGLLVLLTVR